MTRIAIIGANDFQNPLILEANSRGFETHVFAWRDNAIGERTASVFHPVSITEKEEILRICETTGVDAVCSIGSDLAAITVNYIANHLHLPANPPETALIATNKYAMRDAFRQEGLPVPAYIKIAHTPSDADLDAILETVGLPLIVKPTDRSGSRGIHKITAADRPALKTAISEARRHSFEKAAIIESFIEGPEFSCECISCEGKHTMLAITRKFTTGAPHFIETGHIEPSMLDDETVRRVQATVFKGLDALHVTTGASHSEFRVCPGIGDIRLIEIGARMGGDCIGSDLVPLTTGVNYVGQVLDTALGNAPSFAVAPHAGAAAIRFIFSETDLRHMEHLRQEMPETFSRVNVLPVPEHASVTDSSTRYGFYILTASEPSLLLRRAGLELQP